MKISIDNAEESLIKTVRQSGNGGYVYIPARWIGREVQIILLKEDEKMINEELIKNQKELIKELIKLGFKENQINHFSITELDVLLTEFKRHKNHGKALKIVKQGLF